MVHARAVGGRRSRTLAVAAQRTGDGAVELRRHAEPYALCIGLARPVVVVSTTLLEMLTSEELVAVVAHEQRHRRRRAPLRELAATAIVGALFFLPTLDDLADAHRVDEEVVADHEAVLVAGRRPLVHALAKLTDLAVLMPSPAVAITGADTLGARLYALQHGSLAPLRLHRRRLALSVAAVAALLLVAVWMPAAGTRHQAPGTRHQAPGTSVAPELTSIHRWIQSSMWS